MPSEEVLNDLKLCQERVHKWGEQNRVSFDAGKEEFAVLHHQDGEGRDFRLLGPVFDAKLLMHSAVQKVVSKAKPKTQALLKLRRYYSTSDLVYQFKAHVLCVLKSCTAAVYHAASSVLRPLDRVLDSFLEELKLSREEAFLRYNLAPLTFRRDVAMLGLLHKCTLGLAHPRLQELFPPAPLRPEPRYSTRASAARHSRQLLERCKGHFLETTRRSVFGLVKVYNYLSQDTVDLDSVKSFQAALTAKARKACTTGDTGWANLYSPRLVRQG